MPTHCVRNGAAFAFMFTWASGLHAESVWPGQLVCSVAIQAETVFEENASTTQTVKPEPAAFVMDIWDRRQHPEIGHRRVCEWYKESNVPGSADIGKCVREQIDHYAQLCAAGRGFTPSNMQCPASHEAELTPSLSFRERWVSFDNLQQWALTVFAGFIEFDND